MKRGRSKIKAAIPTASMADIAFLLIVFFMITTKFQVDKQTVNLPATVLRDEILAESAFISIAKTSANTQANLNGWHVRFSDGTNQSTPILDIESLGLSITKVVNNDPQWAFVIKADNDVPYETFDLVRETLRDAGARNVTFLSKQKLAER